MSQTQVSNVGSGDLKGYSELTGTDAPNHHIIQDSIKQLEYVIDQLEITLIQITGSAKKEQPDAETKDETLCLSEFLKQTPERIAVAKQKINTINERIQEALFE